MGKDLFEDGQASVICPRADFAGSDGIWACSEPPLADYRGTIGGRNGKLAAHNGGFL